MYECENPHVPRWYVQEIIMSNSSGAHHDIELYLKEGWEPFAASDRTISNSGWERRVYLKKFK